MVDKNCFKNSSPNNTTIRIKMYPCQRNSYLSELKFAAAVMASSSDLIRNGTRLQPGDLRIFSSWETVLSIMNLRHMSTLVMTTNTGTPRARANPRCSLVVPATTIQQHNINL